jgi:hypothetical protein
MKTNIRRKQTKRLHLRTTGGMGIALEGNIDLDALPDELAHDVHIKLTPRKLSYVVRRKSATFMPGQQEYEITLFTGAKGDPKRYAFTDQQADPELLDLLDELTSIIIAEKVRARKAAKEPPHHKKEDPPTQLQPSQAESISSLETSEWRDATPSPGYPPTNASPTS